MNPEIKNDSEKTELKEIKTLDSCLGKLEDIIWKAKVDNIDLKGLIQFDSKNESFVLKGFKSEGDTVFNDTWNWQFKIEQKDALGNVFDTTFAKDGKFFKKDTMGNLQETDWDTLLKKVDSMSSALDSLILEEKSIKLNELKKTQDDNTDADSNLDAALKWIK